MTEADAIQRIIEAARRMAFLGSSDHDYYIVDADAVRRVREALVAYDQATGNDADDEEP